MCRVTWFLDLDRSVAARSHLLSGAGRVVSRATSRASNSVRDHWPCGIRGFRCGPQVARPRHRNRMIPHAWEHVSAPEKDISNEPSDEVSVDSSLPETWHPTVWPGCPGRPSRVVARPRPRCRWSCHRRKPGRAAAVWPSLPRLGAGSAHGQGRRIQRRWTTPRAPRRTAGGRPGSPARTSV